jgi:hypothetical protein
VLQPLVSEDVTRLEAQCQSLASENELLKASLQRAQSDDAAQAETISTLQSTAEQLRFLNDESQATVGSLLEKLDEATLARDTAIAFDKWRIAFLFTL